MKYPNLKPIKLGSNSYKDLWDTWRFSRDQKNRLLVEIKARLSVFQVYEYFGGQLYYGGQEQSAFCCLHKDSKRSAKVFSDHYRCYAGCGNGDVIWLLREAWGKIGYGDLIKRADTVFGLNLRDDNEVALRVMEGGPVSVKKEVGDVQVLDRMKLNRVYQFILGKLNFLEEDKQRFIKNRNLGESVISKMVDRGYRSWRKEFEAPLISAVCDILGFQSFSNVPGFWKEGQIWRFKASDGVIFPVRDISGLITALLVRTEDFDRKYDYVTSSGLEGGSKPEYGFHVIRNGRSFKNIWIIEGILKSDIASLYMKDSGLIIGLPSLTGGRSGLFDLIKQFPDSSVYLCMDSDWRSKEAVRKGVITLAQSLIKNLSQKVYLGVWDPADGKGIDDVLVNKGRSALEFKGL